MGVIDVAHVSFAYEKDLVLDNISLTVEKEDFLAIIGPNGGGKSTFLKLMLGILKPNKGTIRVLGKEPSKNLSSIGYVPQNTNVNTDFPIKVIEVVMMGHVGSKRPLFGYAKEEIACAMGALAQVGMEAYADHKIGSLSGGQRQRVMIARALCAHPSILILDEPTASIDVAGQRDIYELLKALSRSVTIIVVSHDIAVILEYANKAAHINKTLSYHDIPNKEKSFLSHIRGQHFCEVELLQMLGSKRSRDTSEPKNQWRTTP